MTHTKFHFTRLIGIGTLAFLPLLAAAQESEAPSTSNTSRATSTATTTTNTSKAAPELLAEPDLEATFNAFNELLRQHPSEVGKVLKLDPTLFRNELYMASYPALSAFVARHPEIPQNPRYFLQQVYAPGEISPRTASERIWDDISGGIAVFAMFLLVTGVLTWLIRTVIDYRRWSRLSRVQAEVHGKLLDRFTANDDLLAYIQTPAGKRFLESAPIPLSEAPRSLGAPVNRVLWSLQIGIVLAAAGIGLLLISGRVDKEAAQPFFAMAVLAAAIGFGFVASAVMAYVVSRRLGLWSTDALPTAPVD